MEFSTIISLIAAGVMALGSANGNLAATRHASHISVTIPKDTPFSSKPGRFSISLPSGFSKPKLETSDIGDKGDKVKLYMHTSLGGNGVCLIGYNDLDVKDMNDEMRNTLLDGAKDGALKNMNATVGSEKNISLGGSPGRSMEFTADNEGQTMHGRFDYYLVGNRLYQVGFIGITESALEDTDVLNYFASFKVLPKGKK
jgi:hypothetical protein